MGRAVFHHVVTPKGNEDEIEIMEGWFCDFGFHAFTFIFEDWWDSEISVQRYCVSLLGIVRNSGNVCQLFKTPAWQKIGDGSFNVTNSFCVLSKKVQEFERFVSFANCVCLVITHTLYK